MPRATGNLKLCPKCGETKTLEHFHKSRVGSDGLHNRCRPCVRADNAAWRAANPDKKKAQKRHDRIYDLKVKYGITPEQYDEMFAAQNGLCAICGEAQEKRLAVDHCHTTGAVRGLLCSPCNLGLGNFRDDPVFLAGAIAYLSK